MRYMFDTALKKVSEVGSYTCALESVEDVRKFMQIRFLGQFVRHELISQSEAEDFFLFLENLLRLHLRDQLVPYKLP